jgi:hypothetical protein
MPHREVARVVPPVAKGVGRRLLVAQVALHDRVTAQHHFADRLPVARHGFTRFGVADLAIARGSAWRRPGAPFSARAR